MRSELLIAFITFAFVGGITPGPNNMLILASGLNYGFRPSMPHIAGTVIGFGLMVFLAGLGFFALLDYAPFVYHILHLVSMTYLMYLAWKIATTRPLGTKMLSSSKPLTFMQAAAFQWVNPKAIALALATISTYVPETGGYAFLINVTIVTVLFAFICVPCTATWALFGSVFRRILSNPTYYRIFNVSMAGLLILSLYPSFVQIFTQGLTLPTR